MPRGIYNRKTAKKPAIKPVMAKRVMRPKLVDGSISPMAPSQADEPKQAMDKTQPYFILGDAHGLHIFGTVDEAVGYMQSCGVTSDNIGGGMHCQILELHMHQKPEPKNVRLTYTL
jgi:hypothetical protein